MYIHAHIYMHRHSHPYTYKLAHTHIHTYIHTCTYTFMHTQIYIPAQIYKREHKYTHTHTYKHAHTMSLDSNANMFRNMPPGPQGEARLFLGCESLNDWLVLTMLQINAKMSQPSAVCEINSKTTLEI